MINVVWLNKKLLLISVIFSLFVAIIFPSININVHKFVSYNWLYIFANNLVVCFQLCVPFYNCFIVGIQIIVHIVMIKSVLCVNTIYILRVIPHLPFELLGMCLSLKLSVIISKRHFSYKIFLSIIVTLFVASIIEVFISGRL